MKKFVSGSSRKISSRKISALLVSMLTIFVTLSEVAPAKADSTFTYTVLSEGEFFLNTVGSTVSTKYSSL